MIYFITKKIISRDIQYSVTMAKTAIPYKPPNLIGGLTKKKKTSKRITITNSIYQGLFLMIISKQFVKYILTLSIVDNKSEIIITLTLKLIGCKEKKPKFFDTAMDPIHLG